MDAVKFLEERKRIKNRIVIAEQRWTGVQNEN